MNSTTYTSTPGVYILQSLKNFRYYIGSTTDVEARLVYHNSGKVKATKNLTPWELKFFQPCKTATDARKLEYGLKSLKRRDYIENIIRDQKIIGKLTQWI